MLKSGIERSHASDSAPGWLNAKWLPGDSSTSSILYPPPPGASEILGLECSGIVDAVGNKVTSRKVGDEVCALLAGGGYAEYVACPEFQAIPKPINLNWDEAAYLPEVYATCWLNLFIEGNLNTGNKV